MSLACFSQSSVAQSISDVAVSGGTTGLGAHFSVPVAQTVNARFGLNYYRYDTKGSTSSVDYKFKLDLNTIDALVDWHPLNNGFRVTGGVLWNGNKITAKAKAKGGTYTINGNTYNASQAGTVKGKIDFDDFAPYLGIGWGNAPKSKGWSFAGDLGIIFQGSPSASLKNQNCTLAGNACDQLAQDVAVEKRKLKDEVKDYRYYPVIRLGAVYRF